MHIRASILVALALVAWATAQSQSTVLKQLQACEKSFSTKFVASSSSSTLECAAYAALNECIQFAFDHIDDNTQHALSAIQLANDIVSGAVSRQTTCDLLALGYGAPSETASHQRSARAVITLYELAARVSKVGTYRSQFQTQIGMTVSQLQQAASSYMTLISSTVDSLFSNNVVNLGGRLASVAVTMSTSNANAATAQTQLDGLNGYISTAVINEQNARTGTQNTISSSIASLSTTISQGLSSAVSDRAAMRAFMSNNNPATALITATVSQAAIESQREVNAASTRVATTASVRVVKSNYLSTAMSTEFSRFDGKCSTAFGAYAFAFPVQKSTNDDAACTTAGTTYYSANQDLIYSCNGNFYNPFLSDIGRVGLPGSKILTPNQNSMLMNALGTNSVWTKCFTGSVDGFNANTFHSQCNNLGNGHTFVVVKENTGRVFGGFTDLPFTTNGYGWRYAYGAWTYRFNPETSLLDVLHPYQYQSYSIYDTTSYGPCFGYGGGNFDWWITSGMTYGYQGQSGYWTYYSYRLNFGPCTSCTPSWGPQLYANGYTYYTLSDFEVWYRSS